MSNDKLLFESLFGAIVKSKQMTDKYFSKKKKVGIFVTHLRSYFHRFFYGCLSIRKILNSILSPHIWGDIGTISASFSYNNKYLHFLPYHTNSDWDINEDKFMKILEKAMLEADNYLSSISARIDNNFKSLEIDIGFLQNHVDNAKKINDQSNHELNSLYEIAKSLN